jgi:hypothetical protein
MSEPYDATPFMPAVISALNKHVRHVMPVQLRGAEDVELLAQALVSELWREGVRLAAAEKPKPVRKPSVQGCASCQHGPHEKGRCAGEPGDPCECHEPVIVYSCERCGGFEALGCICYAR